MKNCWSFLWIAGISYGFLCSGGEFSKFKGILGKSLKWERKDLLRSSCCVLKTHRPNAKVKEYLEFQTKWIFWEKSAKWNCFHYVRIYHIVQLNIFLASFFRGQSWFSLFPWTGKDHVSWTHPKLAEDHEISCGQTTNKYCCQPLRFNLTTEIYSSFSMVQFNHKNLFFSFCFFLAASFHWKFRLTRQKTSVFSVSSRTQLMVNVPFLVEIFNINPLK